MVVSSEFDPGLVDRGLNGESEALIADFRLDLAS
tara:strand:+ start:546 stop:647 length:102 start_codon:yes stop_codon:yes gene_type:complete